MAEARATTNSAGRVLAMVAVQLWMMLRSTEAATYVVGDATGWSNPANGSSFYSSWASGHTFEVGDILVFNFISGQHDVTLVTASDFNSCSIRSPNTLMPKPPVNFTLTNAMTTYYFICSHDSHCSQGQKLSVTINMDSGPTTSPSGTTTPPPPPPPANSSTGHMYVPYLVIFTSMAISLIS